MIEIRILCSDVKYNILRFSVFLQIITEGFRDKYPGVKVDFLLPEDRTQVEEVSSLFDNVVLIESLTPAVAEKALQTGKVKRYDVSLLITEQSSIGFDEPDVYNAAKMLGHRVLLVDYNMKFYNRFISLWIAPVRKYARNGIFYRQGLCRWPFPHAAGNVHHFAGPMLQCFGQLVAYLWKLGLSQA